MARRRATHDGQARSGGQQLTRPPTDAARCRSRRPGGWCSDDVVGYAHIPMEPADEDEGGGSGQQQQHQESESITEAGAVRALIRATGSVYRTIVFGSFPRRVPVKAIGPLTDRLATAYETVSALRDAHQEQRQQQQDQAQQDQAQQEAQVKGAPGAAKGGRGAAVGLWLQKLRLLGSTAAAAAPTLVRSAALGTVVFELYEGTKDRLDEEAAVDQNPLLLPVTCTAAGGVAGACHGGLYWAWEHGRAGISRLAARGQPYVTSNVLGGTAAAHALAHASLFGSFEVVKEGLFAATGARHEEPLGVALVGLAGGLAGVCEEVASHFTQAWEQEGVVSLRQAAQRYGLPQLRYIARTAAVPSAVGFLSFEYGREAILSRLEKDAGDGDDW